MLDFVFIVGNVYPDGKSRNSVSGGVQGRDKRTHKRAFALTENNVHSTLLEKKPRNNRTHNKQPLGCALTPLAFKPLCGEIRKKNVPLPNT